MVAVSSPPPAPAKRDWTLLEVLGWTTARFSERGLPSPRLDAELILGHALGLSRIEVYTRADRVLTTDELTSIRGFIKRRQDGEPVGYLVGKKEFWNIELRVDARVLIPRPDSETLVELGLERIPAGTARVLDVGTGSGALALALAKSRPEATVLAFDRSEDALAVARDNATRLALPVTFRTSDLLAGCENEAPFDLIVANLPYIPSGDLPGLQLEVRREPALALDGGPDGLDLIRRLIASALPYLSVGGTLALELGIGQAAAVREACARAGFTEIVTRADLAGIERVVAARKPGGAPIDATAIHRARDQALDQARDQATAASDQGLDPS